MRLLAIVGSLRRGSYNRMTLAAVKELAPPGTRFDEARIDDFPLYNEDVQTAGFPDAVARVAAQMAASDGALIVSPEYNYSIPGVLKNAIDWLSRLPDQPFKNKPVAIMGASMGLLGTGRMQYHLRQVLLYVDA